MTAADLHPDTGLPRPGTCCGVCPPIAGGGYDCTCEGNPRCSETTTAPHPCLPSLGESCGNCHRCTDPTETTTEHEHEHDWKRQRNVTSRGYALPPIEVCQTEGCDAARPAETTTALPRPGDGCQCASHTEDRGGGHYELVAEYEPACPEHSEHVWNPRTGIWEHRAETTTEEWPRCKASRGGGCDRCHDEHGRHVHCRAETTTDEACGDYPAPCNCDDPATHDGATSAETTTATTEAALADLAHLILDRLHFEPGTRDAEMDDVMGVLRRHLLATARTVNVHPTYTVEYQQKIADELGVEREAVLRALGLAAPLLATARTRPTEGTRWWVPAYRTPNSRVQRIGSPTVLREYAEREVEQYRAQEAEDPEGNPAAIFLATRVEYPWTEVDQ